MKRRKRREMKRRKGEEERYEEKEMKRRKEEKEKEEGKEEKEDEEGKEEKENEGMDVGQETIGGSRWFEPGPLVWACQSHTTGMAKYHKTYGRWKALEIILNLGRCRTIKLDSFNRKEPTKTRGPDRN